MPQATRAANTGPGHTLHPNRSTHEELDSRHGSGRGDRHRSLHGTRTPAQAVGRFAGGRRPDGAADPGAGLPAQHRARRPRCHAAAALRGQGARGRAERAHRARGRHGLRHAERLRRAGAHADGRPPRQPGTALQPVPHHRALLADADGAALGPQPPHEQHGRHHRNGHGVSGQHGAAAQQRRAARRDAAPERLQHRLLRQEPRDGAVGGQPLRPDRPLADALGLRQVLRLLRRRDRPVDAHAL